MDEHVAKIANISLDKILQFIKKYRTLPFLNRDKENGRNDALTNFSKSGTPMVIDSGDDTSSAAAAVASPIIDKGMFASKHARVATLLTDDDDSESSDSDDDDDMGLSVAKATPLRKHITPSTMKIKLDPDHLDDASRALADKFLSHVEARAASHDLFYSPAKSSLSAMSEDQFERLRSALIDANKGAIDFLDMRLRDADRVRELEIKIESLKDKCLASEFKTAEMRSLFHAEYTSIITTNEVMVKSMLTLQENFSTKNITSMLKGIQANIRTEITEVYNSLIITNLTPIATHNVEIKELIGEVKAMRSDLPKGPPVINNYYDYPPGPPPPPAAAAIAMATPVDSAAADKTHTKDLISPSSTENSMAIISALNNLSTRFETVTQSQALATRSLLQDLFGGATIAKVLEAIHEIIGKMGSLSPDTLSNFNERFKSLEDSLAINATTSNLQAVTIQREMIAALEKIQSSAAGHLGASLESLQSRNEVILAKILEVATHNKALDEHIKSYLETHERSFESLVAAFGDFLRTSFKSLDDITQSNVATQGLNIEKLSDLFDKIQSTPPTVIVAQTPPPAAIEAPPAVAPPSCSLEHVQISIKQEAEQNALALVNNEMAQYAKELESIRMSLELEKSLRSRDVNTLEAHNRAMLDRFNSMATYTSEMEAKQREYEAHYQGLIKTKNGLEEQNRQLAAELRQTQQITEENSRALADILTASSTVEMPASDGATADEVRVPVKAEPESAGDLVEQVLSSIPMSRVEVGHYTNVWLKQYGGKSPTEVPYTSLAERFKQGFWKSSLPDYDQLIKENLDFLDDEVRMYADEEISSPAISDNHTLTKYIAACMRNGVFITSSYIYPENLINMIAQYNHTLTEVYGFKSRQMATYLQEMYGYIQNNGISMKKKREATSEALMKLNEYYGFVNSGISTLISTSTDSKELEHFFSYVALGATGELDWLLGEIHRGDSILGKELAVEILDKNKNYKSCIELIRNQELVAQTGVANENNSAEHIRAVQPTIEKEVVVPPQFTPRGLNTVGKHTYVSPVTQNIETFFPLKNLDITTQTQVNQDQSAGIAGSGTNPDELEVYYKQILDDCLLIISNEDRDLSIEQLKALGSNLDNHEVLANQLKGMPESYDYVKKALTKARQLYTEKFNKRVNDEFTQESVYPNEDQGNIIQPLPEPVPGPSIGSSLSSEDKVKHESLYDVVDEFLAAYAKEKPATNEAMQKQFDQIRGQNQVELINLYKKVEANSRLSGKTLADQFELELAEKASVEKELEEEAEEAEEDLPVDPHVAAAIGEDSESDAEDNIDAEELTRPSKEPSSLKHKPKPKTLDKVKNRNKNLREEMLDKVDKKKPVVETHKLPPGMELASGVHSYHRDMNIKVGALKHLLHATMSARKERRLLGHADTTPFIHDLHHTLKSHKNKENDAMTGKGVKMVCSHCKSSDERIGKGFHLAKDGDIMHKACFENKKMTSKRKLYSEARGEDIGEGSKNPKIKKLLDDHKKAIFHESMSQIQRPLMASDFERSIPSHIKSAIGRRLANAHSQYIGRGAVNDKYVHTYTALLGNHLANEKSSSNWSSINRKIMRAKILDKYGRQKVGKGINTKEIPFDPTSFNTLHAHIRTNPKSLLDFDD